ncbi:MAG: Nitrate reductase molybdenum cofactor assembly chaperone NarJ [Pseudomonadota bacterium]
MGERARTFKALGLLLTYPGDELRQLLPVIELTLQEEALVSVETQAVLKQLSVDLSEQPLSELQERYTNIFDRTRSLSLHLYEHLYGDSRDRGQAMVDLFARYREHGLQLSSKELPDYLPAFCEFLSALSLKDARILLAEAQPLLGALEERLGRRDVRYAAALSGLRESLQPMPAAIGLADAQDLSAVSVQPESFEEMDANWEDAPVTFGVGAAHDSCQTSRANAEPQLVQLRNSAASASSSHVEPRGV